MYSREGLWSDSKFDPRGDQCLCLGYSENQQGYSVLNISLPLHTVMHTTNVVFPDQFPLAKSFPTEIMSKANELNLSNFPDVLAIENLNEQCIASVTGTYNGKLVIELHLINAPSEAKLFSLCPSRYVNLLTKVHEQCLPESHLSLVESGDLMLGAHD